MVTIVDLSHPIEDGMITYTGLPGPKIADHLSREASEILKIRFEIFCFLPSVLCLLTPDT